jgi:hypothetical protein
MTFNCILLQIEWLHNTRFVLVSRVCDVGLLGLILAPLVYDFEEKPIEWLTIYQRFKSGDW